MRIAFIVLIAALAYLFCRLLFGVSPIKTLREVLSSGKVYTKDVAKRIHVSTNIQFERMSVEDKHNSKKYRYYSFITDLLFAFDLKDRNITVEGFTIALCIFALVVSFLAAFLLQMVFLFFVLAPVVFTSSLAVLFLISQLNARHKKKCLLDAQNILCAVMGDGIYLAVKSSYKMFDPCVQAPFTRFLTNVDHLNMSVVEAVHKLNEDCGGLYDDFCQTVIDYEVARSPGMDELFSMLIIDNSANLRRDKVLARMSDECNRDFFASCIVLAVFNALLAYSTPGGIEFYTSTAGVIMILGLGVAAMIVFTIIQYILAKPFYYKESEDE